MTSIWFRKPPLAVAGVDMRKWGQKEKANHES